MNTSEAWDIYWREQIPRCPAWLAPALETGGWAKTNALFHAEILKKEHGVRVLDAACGIGAGMLALMRHGFELTGSDRSPHAVGFGQAWFDEKSIEARFELVDWSNLPRAFPGMHFDAILCDALVWCETTAEITAAARSFAQVLRPGGIVIFHGAFPEGTRETLAALLETAAARPPLEERCGGLSHRCEYEAEGDALVELHSFTDGDGHVTMCQLRQLYRHTWSDITQAFDDAGGWELEPRLVKAAKEKRRYVVARHA